MSMALAHFAVGAALTLLVASALAPRRAASVTLAVLGGTWAMLPDVHWLVPGTSPLLRAAHESALADAFWLHRLLDAVDPADSPFVAAVAVGGLLATAAIVELRAELAEARLGAATPTHE